MTIPTRTRSASLKDNESKTPYEKMILSLDEQYHSITDNPGFNPLEIFPECSDTIPPEYGMEMEKVTKVPLVQWVKEMKNYAQRRGYQYYYELSSETDSEEVLDTSFSSTFEEQQTMMDIIQLDIEERRRQDLKDPAQPYLLETGTEESINKEDPVTELVLESRILTTASELELGDEDIELPRSIIESFDSEYNETAVPIIQHMPEEDETTSKGHQRRLKGYARQTEGEEEWEWDGIKIISVHGKGKCVEATKDLYPGYRFPYGGVITSLTEGNNYRRKPNRSIGNGLHEYLVSYHRDRLTRTGKLRRERCYVDGHPRNLEDENAKPNAWPGIYYSQADEYENVNAELAELNIRHQPPLYKHVHPTVNKLFVIVTKPIKKRELVEIDYRMGKSSQIKRKFGPAYKEL